MGSPFTGRRGAVTHVVRFGCNQTLQRGERVLAPTTAVARRRSLGKITEENFCLFTDFHQVKKESNIVYELESGNLYQKVSATQIRRRPNSE